MRIISFLSLVLGKKSGENQRWSDIDVGILGQEKIPGHALVKIEEDLENSRIPFKIDVVDFKAFRFN